MEPEGSDPSLGGYLLWSLLALALLLPLLAQVLLVAGVTLAAFLHLRESAGTALVALCIAGSAILGVWGGRRWDPPAHWAWRYGPVLAFLALVWILWAVEMHVTQGDFTRRGLPGLAKLPLLPWLPLAFVAAFGSKWLLLLVPTLALAAYAAGLAWGARGRPATGRLWSLPAAALFGGLAVLMAWQAQERAAGLVPDEPGKRRIAEDVDLYRFRPFAPGNQLVALAPRDVRFGPDDAPRLDGATAAYPLYAAMAQAFYTPEAARKAVQVSRSGSAYDRLLRGDADAIFVAQASEEHARRARELGVELVFTPIGREAFVFLVNEANPVRGLSIAQVRAIYAGRVQRWDEVGGRAERIAAFQRPPNSGSQTVMVARVMQGEQLRKPVEEEVPRDMGGLVRQVAAYRDAPQSLGYSFRYFVVGMQRAAGVRLLAVDGVEPTPENVRSGAYPYTVDVYMVTTQRSRAGTQRLREWLLGPEGQELVEEVGYVAR